MRDKKLIQMPELRSAIKSLNEAKLLKERLAEAGRNKTQLVSSFTNAIEKLQEDQRGEEIPTICAEYFNWMYFDEIDGMENAQNPFQTATKVDDEEDKAKDKPKPKKAKGISKTKLVGVAVYTLAKNNDGVLPSSKEIFAAIDGKIKDISEKSLKLEISKYRFCYPYLAGTIKADQTNNITNQMLNYLRKGEKIPNTFKRTTLVKRAWRAYQDVFLSEDA